MRENLERAPMPGDLTGHNGGDLGGLALVSPSLVASSFQFFTRLATVFVGQVGATFSSGVSGKLHRLRRAVELVEI